MRRFKRLWMTLCVAVLAFSILIGGTSITTYFADAASISDINSPISVSLPKTVYLGESFDVPGGATVTEPNGVVNAAEVNDRVFKATSVGNYVITYKSGDNSYVQNVHSKLKDEFELRVKDGGADIPTVIASNVESKNALPQAALYYKDADTDEFVKYDTANYTVKATIDNGTDNKIGQKYQLSSGLHTVQYEAQLTGLDVFYTKSFEIKAQNAFEDKKAPTINVTGIPKSASLRTKVTLPKATIDNTDDFDKNPRIEIAVTLKNVPVKTVIADKYGYGITPDAAAPAVVFDNTYERSFYPMEIGTYLVTYQSFDDAGNKSIKHSETIDVKDTSAPRLEKIDDSLIPTGSVGWSRSVTKNDGADGRETIDKSIIKFPYPEYSDNSPADEIKVSFTITDKSDSNDSKTVIKFDNIYDTSTEGNGRKFTASAGNVNGSYSKNATFDENGFDFCLADYLDVEGNGERFGDYTAVYRASDKAGVSTTKTYTINVKATRIVDTTKPTIDITVEDYLYVTSDFKEFKLPFAIINDSQDTNPTVVYKLKGATGEVIVENGATVEISATEIKYDEKTVAYTGDLSIEVKATDNVGNFTTVTKPINVAKDADVNNNGNIALSVARTGGGASFKAGTVANLGNFSVSSFKKDFRKFAGVEVLLKDPAGVTLDGISFEYSVVYLKAGVPVSETDADANNDKASIELTNVSFVPQNATEAGKPYVLTVRAFDISGRSVIKSYAIEVAERDTSGGTISAVALQTNGNIYETFKFPYTTANYVPNNLTKPYIVRKFSGAGNFSVMGNELTSYSASTYNIIDGYYDGVSGAEGSFVHASLANPNIVDVYSFTASDNTTPIIKVLGTMPTYFAKVAVADTTTFYKLPTVIAFSEYANVTVEIDIKDPKGESLDEGTDYQFVDASKQYEFRPILDGKYTVTYKAVAGESLLASEEFVIKVGDVIAPSFTIIANEAAYKSSMTLKNAFEFKKLTYDQSANLDQLTDVTFVKELLDPNGTVVYKVEGTGTTGLNNIQKDSESHTFDKAGTYTVVYRAIDKHNNDFEIKETIDVTSSGGVDPIPLKVLRTILIILGVVLIACAVLYFVRYRKVRTVKK